MSCHKDSKPPDCGCDAPITDGHYSTMGHIKPATDSHNRKIWIIEKSINMPGRKTVITICNLNDPVVKEVTSKAGDQSLLVRFVGKVHKECPPEGIHLLTYEHLTMTIDTLTPIVMQPY